jgi:hypothetical protein
VILDVMGLLMLAASEKQARESAAVSWFSKHTHVFQATDTTRLVTVRSLMIVITPFPYFTS